MLTAAQGRSPRGAGKRAAGDLSWPPAWPAEASGVVRVTGDAGAEAGEQVRAGGAEGVGDHERLGAVGGDLGRLPVVRRPLEVADAIGELDDPHLARLLLDPPQAVG